jgi:hypothetical protein
VPTCPCRYFRKFDAAKVPDPSMGVDGKRGCVGFKFIAKDRSNIRPFVSFLEQVFLCPDIKDRVAEDILTQA